MNLLFLNKKTHFISSISNQLFIGLLIGLFLFFTIFFIKPFNSNEFYSPNDGIIVFGFGVLFFVVYTFHSFIEVLIVKKTNLTWKIKNEIISILIFVFVCGTVLYLYNYIYINKYNYSLNDYFFYLIKRVLVFTPIILPTLLFLRFFFGEIKVPFSPEIIAIKGINKKEYIEVKKNDLLYIKASENYISIFYVDKNTIQKVLFRNTLSNIQNQIPFLEKCHRSYLINIEQIKDIRGNTQNGTILINGTETQIPLSKTYYKKIIAKISG